MTVQPGRDGWRWSYLVTQVLVALWILVLIGGLVGQSRSQVGIAAVNLAIWGAACAWANRRMKSAAGTRLG